MASKYFLKSSKIPTTQEKQFKTTLKHHLTLIRMVIITKTDKKKIMVRFQGKRNLYTSILVECRELSQKS